MAKKLLFAVLFSMLFFGQAWPNYDVKLADVLFDGGFVFFPVKRAKLQQRLDEINSQFSNENDKLFLPTKAVLAKDEHVIMVGFGSVDAVPLDGDLMNAEKQTESTLIEGLTIAIPYLTSKNGDTEKITFQMKLYTSEGGHYIQSNVILPTPIVAEHLSRVADEHTTSIRFEKGDLHLHLFGEHQGSCVSHGEQDIEDVKEYEHELQISLNGPDFSFCDQFPRLHVDLCNIYSNPLYHSVLLKEGTNVCQYWVPTEDAQACDSTFDVLAMSPAMKALLLLDDQPHVLQGVLQSGTFDIRLVFPCIEVMQTT